MILLDPISQRQTTISSKSSTWIVLDQVVWQSEIGLSTGENDSHRLLVMHSRSSDVFSNDCIERASRKEWSRRWQVTRHSYLTYVLLRFSFFTFLDGYIETFPSVDWIDLFAWTLRGRPMFYSVCPLPDDLLFATSRWTSNSHRQWE